MNDTHSTFAALGNGSADLFSSFSAITSAQTPKLAISELIGSAGFVSLFIIGCVTIIKPFRLPRRPLIRDLLFFGGAIIWLIIICHRGTLLFYEGIGMIVYYFFYASTVIIAHLIYKKSKLKKRNVQFVQEEEEGEKRLIEEYGNGSIGFSTFTLPIALTFLFNLYHKTLHEFFYLKNIYKTDNFLPIQKIYKSHYNFIGGEYEDDSSFEKRIIDEQYKNLALLTAHGWK
jgi:Ca2+/Na+ antiporter